MHSKYLIFIVIISMACLIVSCGSKTPTPVENAGIATNSTPGMTVTLSVIPQNTDNSTVTVVSTPAETNQYLPETTPITRDTPDFHDFRVVGYITHWHLNRLSSINIEGLTHLIWQGIEVTNSGNPTLRVANNAGWWQIKDVVLNGHHYGVKVLASLIGHWDESDINAIWRVDSYRKELIKNLVELVIAYNLDGIDIDNENKGWDKNIYSTFVKELHAELSPLGKIITIAGSPYRVCLTPDVYSMVDFINLMTYDMGSPDHSTFEDSMQAIDLWIDEDFPKEKLLIGIPFYGRDGNNSFYEYWWIIENYSPSPDQNEVSESDAYGGTIWWNGQDLAKEKVLYMKNNGFGGIMLYELGQDCLNNCSLLQTIYDVLGKSVATNATEISANKY